jgi:hypothetical protein
MRSAADCQVDCALVQVVLAGTSPGRSASLSEAPFLFLGANYTYRTGSLLEFLVPLLEGHPPFQTGVGFANRLRIQSHRPTGWGSRRWKRKCDRCRNYKHARGIGPFLGTGTHAQQRLSYSPKISKKWKRPVCPYVCPHVSRPLPLNRRGKHPVYPWLPVLRS